MSDNFLYVGGQEYQLAGSGCTATANSVTLKSFKHINPATGDPEDIAMSHFGAVGFGTLEPKTSKTEFISFTGVTQNSDGSATLTGVTRGLRPYTPYDSVSAYKQTHAGSGVFIISNTPAFYDQLAGKANDESVTGIWTFTEPNIPRLDTAHTYVAGEEEFFITKRYADSVLVYGAPLMSTTTAGIAEEATQAEFDAGTATGGTGARLITNPSTVRAKRYNSFASSTTGTDAYAITISPIITAYTDGDVFVFEADVANTGAATLNVSGIGAKSIVKYGNVALADGDIKQSSIVMVIYDADSDTLMLQTAVSNPQLTVGNKEIYATSVTGNDTYVVTYAPVPTAYIEGAMYVFKPDVANTGAASINANALGAKTIKKWGSGGKQDLTTGDIQASQPVVLVYDGTDMVIVSAQQPRPLFKTGNTTHDTTTTTTTTIAHGLGIIPRFIRMNVNRNAATSSSAYNTILSIGTYDGTTQNSNWAGFDTNGTKYASGQDTSNAVYYQFSTSGSNDAGQTGLVAADATNITITWTNFGGGTSGTANIIWEAYA